MLQAIHDTMRRLLYELGQINPYEIDITFEAPTSAHIDKLVRPTINLFLFDLQENTELRQSHFETTRTNGRAERRPYPRRFDLRYMVSALTTVVEDEHQLLWRVLVTLMQYTQFPTGIQTPEIHALEPALVTRLGQNNDAQRLSTIWNALGVPPHPALCYIVTVPVEMNQVIEAPLVLSRTTRYQRLNSPEKAQESSTQIGGVVRNAEGELLADIRVEVEGKSGIGNTTDAEGRFVLRNVPTGAVRLRTTQDDGVQQIVTVQVPAAQDEFFAYDIVLKTAADTVAGNGDIS